MPLAPPCETKKSKSEEDPNGAGSKYTDEIIHKSPNIMMNNFIIWFEDNTKIMSQEQTHSDLLLILNLKPYNVLLFITFS